MLVKVLVNALKWLRRTYGYVYLHSDKHPEILWRFKTKFGRVAFPWNTPLGTIPFICRLSTDGKVLNPHKNMSGSGKQFGDWTWWYFYPIGFPLENIRIGGYWN